MCACACLHVVCVCANAQISVSKLRTYVRTYRYVCTCMYICTCVYVGMYVGVVYVLVHVRLCRCRRCLYVYAYVSACVHASEWVTLFAAI